MQNARRCRAFVSRRDEEPLRTKPNGTGAESDVRRHLKALQHEQPNPGDDNRDDTRADKSFHDFNPR
jgi:hypothetical protein